MSLSGRLVQWSDLAVAALLMLVTAMLVVPLPTPVIDFFLIANMAFAVVTVLVTIYATDPLQFSSFPSMLLASTLFRLALNIAMARLILTRGAAGDVVAAFGGLVVGGSMIVGLVIFAILLIIQFVVITNGAGRMAEVAARFTLDAMPGKQMSIDAELNAGTLSEDAARERRRQVERQADFFGAMDGASKFVRGDAIAGLLITAVNLLGGIGVGTLVKRLDATQALQTYALQAVGAGLVIQIPALLVSVASGLILTRTAGTEHLGADMLRQLLARWRPLAAAGAIVGLLGLFPGLPKLPFLLIAAMLGLVALQLRAPSPVATQPPAPAAPSATPEAMHALAEVDTIALEVGLALIPLVDVAQGGDLLDRIVMLRRHVASTTGLVVPAVRVRDHPRLPSRTYRVTIRGVEVARAEVIPGSLLAMRTAPETPSLPGVHTVDPAFGVPAVWISENERAVAQAAGYEVVEPTVVIATHLGEVVRRHGWRLLTRLEVQALLDRIKERHKTLLDELVPGLMTVGDVQKVLQALLRDGVPIRDLGTILETLADSARAVKDPDRLTEAVRRALGRGLYQHLLCDEGTLAVLVLDGAVEQYLIDAVASNRPLDVDFLQHLQGAVRATWQEASVRAAHPVLLCSSAVRLPVRRLLESSLPQAAVLAYEELDPTTPLKRLGTVTVDVGAPV